METKNNYNPEDEFFIEEELPNYTQEDSKFFSNSSLTNESSDFLEEPDLEEKLLTRKALMEDFREKKAKEKQEKLEWQIIEDLILELKQIWKIRLIKQIKEL